MTQIFISYSRRDLGFVEQLASDLKEVGLDVWYDLSSLDGGTRWRIEIENAIRTSQHVVMVLSPDSVGSEWVEREYLFANNLKKNIVPILYKPCDLPLYLLDIHYIDVQDANYSRNLNVLLRVLGKPAAKSSESSKKEAQTSATPKDNKKETDTKKLESIAIQYELKGDFWNARKTWYEIKRIDPLFPRVDVKIKELEYELRPKPTFIPRRSWSSTVAILFLLLIISIPLTYGIKAALPMSSKTPLVTLTSLNLTPIYIVTVTSQPFPVETVTSTSMPAEVTDARGVEMVLVPSGEFTMGSESGYANERPIHTLYMDEFYIDKYEVTNIRYKACVDAGICKPPMDLGHYSNSRYSNHPVVFVDWNMASAYCMWRGARLPTEAEWEKAARGTDRRIYPWGNDFDPMKANVYLSGLSDTNAVGMYESGRSPFGIYDLTGSVGEWTSSLYQSYPYNSKDGREDQISPDKRILRGGSFENTDIDTRTTSRFAEDPSKFSRVVGFRCAKDATTITPPETLTPVITPTFASSLTNTPEVPASGFVLISINKIAYRGGIASAQIRTQPGTSCTLTFFLPSGTMSSADGVGACTADQDGYCTWSWTVHANVNPGTGTIVIIADGQSESYAIKIE